MELKHFWGRDMEEALRAVRAALGPDALILETRSAPAENGTGKNMGVQITAVRDAGEAPASSASPADEGQQQADQCAAVDDQRLEAGSGQNSLSEPPDKELPEVRRELAALKSILCWLIPGIRMGGTLEELVAQGLSPNLVARLAQEMREIDGTDEREKIRQVLTRLIPTGGDVETRKERRECLALIGPTGVGKTTTAVKLTVRLACRGERRVGWVSLDNRRIAGAEQLAVYAGILGVPYEVAESREGLVQALGHLSSCDLVLIDTAGISPRDSAGLSELAELLQSVPDLQRTLLLSATTNGQDMAAWVETYGTVGFDSLLFTKVDECSHFGPMITIALTCGRPLSYITTGQQLTSDLEVARAEVLACLLLP
jgi:flagellar biosynthesis protein FlhF